MNLLQVNSQLYPVNLNLLKLQTPLGSLFFNCELIDTSIINIPPTKIEAINPKTVIASWFFDNYLIEFLRLNFSPSLPLGMKIDECICGIWRIKSLKEMNASFSCFFENDLEGYPESGERLIAQSFENNSIKLTIGTEDEESLAYQAKSQCWLPRHFESEISANHIEYLSNGIRVNFPKLYQNEHAQMHFVVAWSSKQNSEASTWYAVDQSPIEILKQAGVN